MSDWGLLSTQHQTQVSDLIRTRIDTDGEVNIVNAKLLDAGRGLVQVTLNDDGINRDYIINPEAGDFMTLPLPRTGTGNGPQLPFDEDLIRMLESTNVDIASLIARLMREANKAVSQIASFALRAANEQNTISREMIEVVHQKAYDAARTKFNAEITAAAMDIVSGVAGGVTSGIALHKFEGTTTLSSRLTGNEKAIRSAETSLKDGIEPHSRKLESLDEAKVETRRSLDSHKAELDALDKSIHNRLQTLDQDIKAKQGRADEINRDLADHANGTSTLDGARRAQLETERTQLNADINQIKTDFEVAKQKRTELQKSIDTAEADLKNLDDLHHKATIERDDKLRELQTDVDFAKRNAQDENTKAHSITESGANWSRLGGPLSTILSASGRFAAAFLNQDAAELTADKERLDALRGVTESMGQMYRQLAESYIGLVQNIVASEKEINQALNELYSATTRA